MNENLDLTKILKDCPEDTKLYSPIFGVVELVKVHNDGDYPIEVRLSDNALDSFTKDGRIFTDYDGECVLFPSKKQRDWSKFKAVKKWCEFDRLYTEEGQILLDAIKEKDYKWNKKPKFDPKTLQPFDKVLVRDDHNQKWECSLFSYINIIDDIYYPYFTIINAGYKYCIPYNSDTKHLVGTNEEAPEYYRYWED